MTGKKEYKMGPVTSIVFALFPWLVGVIHIVKWIIEGAF